MKQPSNKNYEELRYRNSKNKENKDINASYTFSKDKSKKSDLLNKYILLKGKQQIRNQEQNQSNFIQSINGYIKAMKNQEEKRKGKMQTVKNQSLIHKEVKEKVGKKDSFKENHQHLQDHCNRKSFKSLSKQIKKEKTVNTNLQKCIIEIQKILWERSQHLEKMQNQLKIKRKQSKMKYTEPMSQSSDGNQQNENEEQMSKQELKNWWLKQNKRQNTSISEIANQNSNSSVIESQETTKSIEKEMNKIRQRRKTEIPLELHTMLTKTVAMKNSKGKQRKQY